MSPLDINYRVLICFLVLFVTASLIAKLNCFQLSVKSFVEYVETVAVPGGKELMKTLTVKVPRRKSARKEVLLLAGKLSVRPNLETEKIRQALRLYPAVHTYAKMNSGIRRPLRFSLFQKKSFFSIYSAVSSSFIWCSTTVNHRR